MFIQKEQQRDDFELYACSTFDSQNCLIANSEAKKIRVYILIREDRSAEIKWKNRFVLASLCHNNLSNPSKNCFRV